MVSYYVYATDDSWSTEDMEYFNTKGLETLKNFNDEVKALQSDAQHSHEEDSIVYLHWSERCIRVEENEVISRYTEKNGKGKATLPRTVLDWLAANITENYTIKLLYIITDCEMHDPAIRPCYPNMKIDKLTFYAINIFETIDLSVVSMFIYNAKRFILYYNEELVDEADLSNPYDYDQISIETFNERKEHLKSYIKLQFLTKKPWSPKALQELKNLNRLRMRLFDEFQTRENNNKTTVNLNVKDKSIFIEEFMKTTFYKILKNPNLFNEKQNIDSSINTLINYINKEHKSFSFHNLEFSQKITPASEEEQVFDVDYENAEEISFPDISMSNETGISVLLLNHYNLIEKILFKSDTMSPTHYSHFRSTIECPLILLHDNNFRGSIECYYNLKAFKSMIENGIQIGPCTRQEFTGAIVPLEEFDDYNDYILTCTYFNKRKVPYNKGLLYYVIYKTCENLEYIEPNVVEHLKRYVVKRIANTKCYLGLSGASTDDPMIRVNTTTALWYCVEISSTMFKDDPEHYTKEKMRIYCDFVEYMKEILTWFDYSIDTNLIDLRADIFKNLNMLTRISRPEDKVMFILEQIFMKDDGFLVAEIVNLKNIYKLNYVQMDHKKVINEAMVFAEVDIEKFAHFMYHDETTDVTICRRTMRPHFVTEDRTPFYAPLMKKSHKVIVQNGTLLFKPVSSLNISRILPLYKLYIFYVHQHSKFPTMEQYKLFVLKKKQFYRDKPVVFATNTLIGIKHVYDRYEKIITDQNDPIDVNKFIKITKQSVNKENRIKQEEPIGFNIDDLTVYIKKSESNLKIDSD